MISVHVAETPEDFASASTMFHMLATWDAKEAANHGVPADFVLQLFHAHADDPTAKYRAPDARLFIARSDGTVAGCVAIDYFDGGSLEIHKLFVDPALRSAARDGR